MGAPACPKLLPVAPWNQRYVPRSASAGEQETKTGDLLTDPVRCSEMRDTQTVLEDHLVSRQEHGLAADIDANYGDDPLILTSEGVFRGKAGLQEASQILRRNLPDATYRYDSLTVAEGCGLLGWTAVGNDGSLRWHGADAFTVRDGMIEVHMIHYRVSNADAASQDNAIERVAENLSHFLKAPS